MGVEGRVKIMYIVLKVLIEKKNIRIFLVKVLWLEFLVNNYFL